MLKTVRAFKYNYILTLVFASILLAVFGIFLQDVVADEVEATIQVGEGPYGVRVNPNTDRIYVTNLDSKTISVIDGKDESVIHNVTLDEEVPCQSSSYCNQPGKVGVNPATNKAYVVLPYISSVAVIDGATNTVESIVPVGFIPAGIGVNPLTNKIYVANWQGESISIIDGITNIVIPIPLEPESFPYNVAVNENTGLVYVTGGTFWYTQPRIFLQWVKVIEGAAVVAEVLLPSGAAGIAVNSETNMVYVTSYDKVFVINGITNTIDATIQVGMGAVGVAVNESANKIYVVKSDGMVSVIDGATNAVLSDIIVGTQPRLIDVNPVTNKVYVSNYGNNTVSVIEDNVGKN